MSDNLIEQNDQDQPVAATDLPCEKPPTATRLHLIVMLVHVLQLAKHISFALGVLDER